MPSVNDNAAVHDGDDDDDVVIVHMYHDIDAADADSQYRLVAPPGGYTAEALCELAAVRLDIDPLALHTLALSGTSASGGRYYAPCERVRGSATLRVRVLPPRAGLPRLADRHPGLLHYLFLQCRADLTGGAVAVVGSVGRERLLGLAVLDMLRVTSKGALSVDELFAAHAPHCFLPPASRHHFRLPWRQLRLRHNVRRQMAAQSRTRALADLELEYVMALAEYAPAYAAETFATRGLVTAVVVDAGRDFRPGVYVRRDASDDEKFLCAIPDLLGVEIRDAFSSVHIFRRDGIPHMLSFEEVGEAMSFASLLSAYYRLSYDFHQPLCERVTSPIIVELRRLRSHGPVSSEWAMRLLQQRHLAAPNCNYLLKQRRRVHGGFVIAHFPPSPPGAPPELISVARLAAGGGFQVSSHSSEPVFPSMQQLVAHYSSDRSPAWIRLKTCITPMHPCNGDSGVYLCRQEAVAPPGDGHQNHDREAAGGRVVVYSSVTLHGVIGRGRYTEVQQGRVQGRRKVVAVKTLRPDSQDKLERLQQGVHSATWWSHPDIAALHGVCLAMPFRVVSEYAPLGALADYLLRPRSGPAAGPAASVAPLYVFHLVAAMENVAQALFYLEELVCSDGRTGDAHGNIRARNVLVFAHAGSVMQVKLADGGLVRLYNEQPISSDDNVDRLPWIAPENYNSLSHMTTHADVYAYGTLLWEVFSVGARPHSRTGVDQIMDFVRAGLRLDRPAQCPGRLYDLMLSCWDVTPQLRPTARQIVCKIKSVLSKVDVGNAYSDPMWSGVEVGAPAAPGGGGSGASAAGDNAANDARDDLCDLLHQPVLPPGGGAALCDSRTPLLADTSASRSAEMGGGAAVPAPAAVAPVAAPTTGGATDSGFNADPACALSPAEEGKMAAHIQRRPLPDVPTKLQNELRPEDLQLNEECKLGRGHYGVVYKGQLETASGTQVIAIKCLHKQMYHKYFKEFEREIRVMQTLHHVNIVRLIGHLPQRSAERPLLLVMEFVELGCLSVYLREHRARLDISVLLRFGAEIAEGMRYLSGMNIVHRDLAARNILVTFDEKIKISDFGLSRCLDPERDYYRSGDSKEIPAPWCAPEGLQREFRPEGDVWSYGVTLWEVFSYGATPHLCSLSRLADALYDGARLAQPAAAPAALYRLMLRCWQYFAADRCTFAQICVELAAIRADASAG